MAEPMPPETETQVALVIGATSDIGRALARRLAEDGFRLQLAARDLAQLDREAQDLQVRGASVLSQHHCDALAGPGAEAWLDALQPLPDLAICVLGLLGDQAQSQLDAAAAERVMRTNYLAPALLLGALAQRFEQRGSGVLVGFSSVAGDRGRASNYIYGSAKAGLTALLSGLRGRLAKRGAHVLTVKPGFVYTRMTDGMNLPPSLTATPEEIAEAVAKAIRRRRNLIYARPIWRFIMLIMRAIPEFLFKRMRGI